MPDSTISSERDENSVRLFKIGEKNNPFSRPTSTVGSCDSSSDTLGLTILSIACCCSARADDFAHTSGNSSTDFQELSHVLCGQ